MDEFEDFEDLEIEASAAAWQMTDEESCFDVRQIEEHYHYSVPAAQYQNSGCGCLMPIFTAFLCAVLGVTFFILCL